MNDFIPALLALIVLVLMLAPFFIVVTSLFPTRISTAQANIERMPGRSFAVGLVNLLFLFAIALVLFALGDKADGFLKALLTVPALLIAALLAAGLALGLAAAVGLLGERIAPQQAGWRRVLWGTLLLGIACGVPFVGWFLLLPYAGFAGTGGLILSFFPTGRMTAPKEQTS